MTQRPDRVHGSAGGRPWRALAVLARFVLPVALVAACSPAVVAVAKPSLHLANGTPLTISLLVNGQAVAEYEPGAPEPSIDSAGLPSLPWTVEARTASGRLLTSMVVAPGEVTSGGDVHQIPMGRIDLSCGRVTIYAGDFAPSGPPPAASPGVAGDCEP